MYEIAEPVAQWLAEGTAVRVAQIVETRGFSSRDPSAALATTDDGRAVGALIPGLVASVPPTEPGLVEIAVGDADAAAAGLSCGGLARVLVQDASAMPAEVWARLRRREPLALVHARDGSRTQVFTPSDVRAAAELNADIPRLFARGSSATALTDDFAIVTLWPPTTLLVVGDGAIADALATIGSVLGWTGQLANDADTAVSRAGSLTESDAIVVLSHDRSVDVPALAAVLAGRCGYVGALGSRGTQAARQDGLIALGISADQLARIHGPAGLDLGAHTPGEIAVSIVAEVLAARSGTAGGSISARGGPVHLDGVDPPHAR